MASSFIDQSLDIANVVMIVVEGVLLPMILVSMVKYVKRFGKTKDPYTFYTFVLLSLSLFADVCVAPLLLYYAVNDFTPEERKAQPMGLKCYSEATWELSKCFFNLAISVNATRWALLILQATMDRSSVEYLKAVKIFKSILVVSSVVILLMTIVTTGAFCILQQDVKREPGGVLYFGLISGALQLAACLLCIGVYIQAYRIFSNQLKGQEHCSSFTHGDKHNESVDSSMHRSNQILEQYKVLGSMRRLFLVISVVVLYRQGIEFSLVVYKYPKQIYFLLLFLRKIGTLSVVVILLCTIR